MNGEAGKGDSRRPRAISEAEERAAWERAFGPGAADIQRWVMCEKHKCGYNRRNPCKKCVEERK